jgi:hypothetical protein
MKHLYHFFLWCGKAKKPVVRPHKKVALSLYQQTTPVAAHSRVDNRHMDRTRREKGCCLLQDERASKNILRWNSVGKINYRGGWMNPQNYPFHDTNEGILEAEICE